MIIMSVDLGKARTGIAVSDSGETFAFPKTVIYQNDNTALVQKIADLAKEYKVELIVVGYPKNMDGTEGSRAKECKDIAEQITAQSQIETVLWDERCTTISAAAALNFNDVRGKKRKEVIDIEAATIILEDYLRYRKNSAHK